ncbi:MAG: hypothetical protein ACREI9_14845 [Nitrospiraceae bacterium]
MSKPVRMSVEERHAYRRDTLQMATGVVMDKDFNTEGRPVSESIVRLAKRLMTFIEEGE